MEIKGNKILVTGGAGFIGSHVVCSLVEQGAEVIVYDNLSSGLMENLESVMDKIKFIGGDILDYQKLEECMRGCDVVSHHAAQLEIFLSKRSPEKDLEVNTIGTLNVLRQLKRMMLRK